MIKTIPFGFRDYAKGKRTGPATAFDAKSDARPLFKERALWALIIGLFFFLVYGSTNQISSLTAPHSSFIWEWEKSIPFVPELIVPYLSSDVVFVIAFLMAPTREAIQKLALRSGLAIMISAAFFLAVPLEFGFQRPDVTGWPKLLFDLLSLDKPYNQLPSLHVSLGFLAWHMIAGQLKGLAKLATTIWFLMILASTQLVYQHHAIDLTGGAAITLLIYWLIPSCGPARIPLRFVSPRHLLVAFRYLIAATSIAVIGFCTWPDQILLSTLFGWIAVAFVLVSANYVLGKNDFLLKKRKGYSPLIWLFYWPYLLGSTLNWLYWRTRVPLMSEVASGIWIGARPGRQDWAKLEGNNIKSVVDLVPEIANSTASSVAYSHIPLLDVAIPDPAILDKIARKINDCTKCGGVYIHCALGMSRSVLGVCAWLIRNGSTSQQALDILDRARPMRVRRPYIVISLELYEDYLRRMSVLG